MVARRVSAAGQLLVFVFGSIGLGISGLLLFEYVGHGAALCGPGGGCDVVRQSSYANIAGVPTPAFGVVYFAGLLVLAAFAGRARGLLPWAAAVGAAVGASLLAIQGFALGAFCKFCVTADVSAVLAFGAALLSSRGQPLGGRPRAVSSGAAALGAAAIMLAGFHWAPPPGPPADVEVVDELPAPVKAEQRDGVVTIVEFVDFQCPHCRHLHHELSKALESFGDRVRVVNKNVPLPGHPQALPAALAAVCAAKQGHLDEMADRLFSADDMSPKATAEMAGEIGIDVEPFRECVRSHEAIEAVTGDIEQAKEAGVRGLPTFFIGHERFEGARSADVLRASIERALSRARLSRK